MTSTAAPSDPPLSETEAEVEQTEAAIRERLADQWWRLNNLYWIVDEQGRKRKFDPNWAQRSLYHGMWYLNVILKARQLGMSTFILIYMLDTCLFNSNVRAGVIAHKLDIAQDLFRDKIKFAYSNLPDWLRAELGAKEDSARTLTMANNSSIRVDTSVRSGTLQMLHVSEFGKICAKYPERAREIITGSFEAVHPGQMIFVESTAEGREGKFYDLCEEAKALQDMGKPLTTLDFKFFFFSWWKHPGNVLDPTNVVIYPPLKAYFDELEAKHGIRLTKGQKAWYAKKWGSLGADVKREHPSTPEEAFEESVEGAYYKTAITLARQQGRVTHVPHTQGVEVDTWWDLGINDTTAIWFTQTVGTAIHVIDYHENAGEGLQHYKDVLDEKARDLGYRYGRHVWPHDGGRRELGTGKKLNEQAAEMGLRVEVLPRGDLQDGIEATRNILSVCWFDESQTHQKLRMADEEFTVGLPSLENYRKEWDVNLGAWKRTPLHNWASHGADAFRTMAVTYREAKLGRELKAAKPVKPVSAQGWT